MPDSETIVRYDKRKGVAVLTIDYPPVNALGAPMRQALLRRLRQANDDEDARAIVIIGANDRFVAGADIREIGCPVAGPSLLDLQNEIEGSSKPVVCALDGHALGGGLELALAAPFRVAAARCRLGLPEVKLGLLPGAGGTQRLTRLVGPEVALELILSGKPISAERAAKLGIVDALVDEDLLDAAVGVALDRAAAGPPCPKAIDRKDKVEGSDPTIFDRARTANATKWAGTIAPFKIVDCIEAACTMAPQAGLDVERAAFEQCRDAPSRAAQAHLFFAERRAAKVDGSLPGTQPGTICKVGVIGAGTMGGGIAMSVVNAGLPCVLLDSTREGLEAGVERVRANYAISVQRGSRTAEQVAGATALLSATLDFDDVGDCDMVIEAAFESMAVKQEIFAKLDRTCKPGAVLATNTSALDIDAIASATERPGDVVGMHFFSPANVMKLCEIVRGAASRDETIATAMAFAKAIGKVPVLAGNCEGFIGNRILKVYGQEADLILEQGATPWQVDGALKQFGFPMGLYLMRDMSGLDVGYRMRQGRIEAGTLDPASKDYAPLADRLVEGGRHGQKTGAGYYRYSGRTASPDPDVESMLAEIAAQKGAVQRSFTDQDIVRRILAAMVNEGAKILDEQVAQRASDIDVAYVNGYGFPRHRGGPMFWASQEGLDKIVRMVRGNHASLGERWRPARLLAELADSGRDWEGRSVLPTA